MVYTEPTLAILNKMRASTRLTALVPAGRIHSAFPRDECDKPGIYITPGIQINQQILSSANQTNRVLMGTGIWQIDAFSATSSEDAVKLGRIACEAVLPSIVTAGIFELHYSFEFVTFDTDFLANRAAFTLQCSIREWITGD